MHSELELEATLSEPSPEDINDLCRLGGDILILGAGGKMGPTLAMRAARALQVGGSRRRVIAVSRFSDASVVTRLQSFGIDIVQADMLNPGVYAELPDAENVIYMVARKFGTAGEESVTWATNAFVPGLVGDRYKLSRIVTWSTGNVYPLYPAEQLQHDYPGLSYETADGSFHLLLPEGSRGRDSLQQIFREFMGFVRDRTTFPVFENDNLLAKYYVTTAAVAMANSKSPF